MPIFTFTALNDPLAIDGAFAGTLAYGINASGQVVGSYNDNIGGGTHGFLYSGGTYTTLDVPDAGANGTTVAQSINGLGQIAGYYNNGAGIAFGFIQLGSNHYRPIFPPNLNDVEKAHAVNSLGEVVGEYTENGITHGFIYLTGLLLLFPLDFTAGNILYGINEAGTIVVGENTNGTGFLDTASGLYPIQDPLGTNGTVVQGVNNAGQVVGYYFDASNRAHGFLYTGGPANGTYTTIDVGAHGTFVTGINDKGEMVGYFLDLFNHYHGFVASFQPNPAPAAGTTAAMILRGANSSASVAGQYEIYDIGNNAILAGYSLGTVGTDFAFAGLGRFFDGDTVDMMLRSSSTGAFEVYDISNNNITNAASLGAVGLNWQVAGFTDFNGDGMSDMMLPNSGTGAFQVYNISNNSIINSSSVGTVGLDWQVGGFGNFASLGESDMVMRNIKTGALEIYDINNNQIANAFSIGMVGLEWQFSGVGDFSSNPGETDLLMRNSKTGGLEVYDIANNLIAGAAFLGTVGLDWQFAGIAPVHAAGAADLVLRNVNTGAFEAYDIANNQLTGAAPLGSVGLDWQLGGLGVDPPIDDSGDAAALVQAMAGFGGGNGAADGLNAGLLNADASQQQFLTTPQHG